MAAAAAHFAARSSTLFAAAATVNASAQSDLERLAKREGSIIIQRGWLRGRINHVVVVIFAFVKIMKVLVIIIGQYWSLESKNEKVIE